MTESSLYKKVINVTSTYLGPAADRFIARQVVAHLNKKPENLKHDDITELVNWIKPAMGILTEDKRLVNRYINELIDLTKISPEDLRSGKE